MSSLLSSPLLSSPLLSSPLLSSPLLSSPLLSSPLLSSPLLSSPLLSTVSINCCVFMLFLFLSELKGFIATEINDLTIVVLSLSLSPVVGLDIQDEMGHHEVGHIDNSMKVLLNHGYGCQCCSLTTQGGVSTGSWNF
uniref:Uncharacterized protein n=1 Tax=Oncorhynchus kisutch TaxID=8019 RepID=A0A8C7J0I3_ONCKI